MADLTKRPGAPRRRAPGARAAVASVAAPDRYAQFTYTSFDDGAATSRGALHGAVGGQRSHGGGWQVKQVVGELEPDSIDELTARIVTRFDLEPALPAFPTPDQIRGRPARLSYMALDGSAGPSAAYWHTVDAGRDGTGRPGNVFAHVLARCTEDGERADGFRPIELWRWSGWLSPYGQDEVKAAALPSGPPALAPNPALSVQSTVTFLLDPVHDRTGVVRVLLDAVSARLSGQARGPVVLAVDDHDRAAAWIAAVSHFLTPLGARALSWSTHDSVDAVAAGSAADLHLVAVPRARAGELSGAAGVVAVVDEDEEPYLGDPGSVHRLAAGTVAVTPLSALAEAVLADEVIALRVLARRDAIAGAFEDRPETAEPPFEALAPEWPIAVAVLEVPELGEFHPDAAAVVVDDAPAGVTGIGWAAELVESVLRAYPPTVDDALRRLVRAAQRHRGTELLAQHVLAGGLADPGWVDRVDLAQVPAVRTAALGGLRAAVADRAAALRRSNDGAAARAVLRTAELVERLAAPDSDHDAARAELSAALAGVGVGAVGTPGWEELFTAEQISEPTLAAYVRPVYAAQSPQDLSDLSSGVALWLYGAAEGVRYARPAAPTGDDDYLFAFATRAVLGDGGLGIPVDARAHYAGEAIRGALRSPRLDDAQCRDVVAAIVAEQRPPAADLLEFAAAAGRVPPQILDSLVFYGDVEDAALRAVLDSPGSASAELVAAAWLRLAARSGTVDRDRWAASVGVLAESASSVPQPGTPVSWVTSAADDLVVMTAAGFVLGQSLGARWADPGSGFCASLRTRMAGGAGVVGLYTEVVDELARAEQARVLDTAWVVGHAVTVAMRVPDAGAGPLDGLGSPSSREFSGPGQLVPWSQWLIEERTAVGGYRGPVDVPGVRDAAWLVLRGLDAAAAEQFFSDYRRVAADWLARTGAAAPSDGPVPRGPMGLGGLG